MAKKFRLVSIDFDENETVAQIVGSVDDDAHQLIASLIGWPETAIRSPEADDMTRHTVYLPVDDAMKLRKALGGINGRDPRWAAGVSDIYDGLDLVYNTLIDE